jgi:23S rRNA (uracil1939-C5)-methyltransferase
MRSTSEKPNEQAIIERLSHEGRGVAKIGGKTTFIDNALPGETVLFKYLKKHSKYDEGVAENILTASIDRAVPECTHFLTCGGCRLQHFSSEAQIAFKQAALLEQFEHFAKTLPDTLLPPLTGPIYGYRRKARLGVRFVIKKEKLLVGFHEMNGRYIADIDSCAVLDPAVSALIMPLKAYLTQLASYRDIPQIEVAVGDNEKALVFRHLNPLSVADQTLLQAFGKQYDAHIYLQGGNLTTTHRIWPETGEERLYYRFSQHNLTLKFHPQDFIQVNGEINQQLSDRVISLLALSKQDQVLDLFCGLGNFTLPIARYCKAVVGIEGEKIMVDRALENAQYNQLNNVDFFQHDLTQPFDNCTWAKRSYQKVLLDPPRSGAREILPSIAALHPTRIVYISCNPATLARDAGDLVHQYGFTLRSAGVMDMFAQTCHVESIAVFEKDT